MLIVPEELQRNTEKVAEEGYETSGQRLMFLARDRTGLTDFSRSDILDIGCGVRFTVTIINRELPVKSYTGIEVHKPIVDFLSKEVDDTRFAFHHWDVHNKLYNENGNSMSSFDELPVYGQYYAQIWLFSVFTHQSPGDTLSMLNLTRKHIRDNGKMVFTCFINEELETFEDEHGDLIHAHYGEKFFHSMIKNSGWSIDKWWWAEFRENNPYGRMYVCSPV